MKFLGKQISEIRRSLLVKDIMTKEVLSLNKHQTVYEAIQMMADNSISTVLIMDNKKLLGIVSESDLVKRILLKEKNPKKTKLEEIMTLNPKTIHPNAPILVAGHEMKEKNVRKLVVIDDSENVIGLVSQTDIIKSLNKIYENYRYMLGNPLISIIIVILLLVFVLASIFFKGNI